MIFEKKVIFNLTGDEIEIEISPPHEPIVTYQLRNRLSVFDFIN